MMQQSFEIEGRRISPEEPAYIVAEISANHGHDVEVAKRVMRAASEAGADAIKVQTYTPDTITLNCDNEYFRIGKGTVWEGRTLYDLYKEASMPWEWQPELKTFAEELGLQFFSTPFDHTSVVFLEKLDVPAYKIASFELVDLPLIREVARTGKPVIISTGMASLSEIDAAVEAVREAGGTQLALLKCTSAYPAPLQSMNLKTLSDMSRRYALPVGLSDHSMGTVVPVVAVSLGASMIEKHITLSRKDKGPDSGFSLEPEEFGRMVRAVRDAEKAVGRVCYDVAEHEKASRVFRRSLFVSHSMKKGDVFTAETVRSVRPSHGLPVDAIDHVLGKKASMDLKAGTPLAWEHVVGGEGRAKK